MIGIILSPIGGEVFPFPPDREIGTDDLELTSEQSQTLQDLKVQFHREQAKIRRKIMIKRMELRTLNSEDLRAYKGEEIRRQIQSLLFQVRERSLFYRQEAYMIFTPEQRKKISSESDLGFHCGGWFRRGGDGVPGLEAGDPHRRNRIRSETKPKVPLSYEPSQTILKPKTLQLSLLPLFGHDGSFRHSHYQRVF